MPFVPSTTTLPLEVRDHVLSYLHGETTLADFEEWFVSATWDERSRIVTSVDHALAEREHLDDDEFREELRSAVATLELAPRADLTGSSARTVSLTPFRTLSTETIIHPIALAST